MRVPPFLIPLAFLGLFFAYPLAVTLGAAAAPDGWQWIASGYARRRILGALLQATLSTLLTLAIAFPLAWHHHRRAIPWSRVHLAVHAAPFVLPVFVVVGAMRELFGAGGWVSRAVGMDLLAAMGPMAVVVLAHAYYNYGFAARILHATLERRPWRMEESAAVLGASPLATRLRVTLPLLAPGFLGVALLVWLFCFTSFGVVLLLGDGVLGTPETLIYQNLAGAFPQADRAAVLGVVQLAINVLLLWGYFRLNRRMERLPQDPPETPKVARRRDHAFALGTLGLGLIPAIAVLLGGFQVRGEWTLEAWRAILDASHPAHLPGFHLGVVVLRTMAYAATSAILSLTLAALLGYGLQRTRRLRPLAEAAAALPLGTSSVLLGLGYILAFGAGSWLDLRGSFIAIVIVHALLGFPFVARTLLPALQQHDTRLDEAAALLGAPRKDVLRRVHWPLLRGPALAAAGFAAAISIGDFGASLLLMQRDTMGLTVWIGEHDRPFDSLMQAQAVALTAVVGVLAAVAYLVVERFRGREAL